MASNPHAAENNAYRPSKWPAAPGPVICHTDDASRYTDITVNYTVSGQHGLDEGFVIRYGEIQPDGSVILRTCGEGDNWRQAPALKPFWTGKVDEVWQKNQKEIIQKMK